MYIWQEPPREKSVFEVVSDGLRGLFIVLMLVFVLLSPWPFWTSIPKHYFPPRPKRWKRRGKGWGIIFRRPLP